MAQKKNGCGSKSVKRKTTSVKATRKASGSSAKRKTSSSTPKKTTAVSTVAKGSDFSGLHSVTVTEKKITVNGKKHFPHNPHNSEVAIRELKKRGVKSVTYRV